MATKPTGRPRGRPPGAKNKPKDILAFVIDDLANPLKAPPRKPKVKRGFNPLPPERRAEVLAKARAARAAKVARGESSYGRGTPSNNLNKEQYAAKKALALADTNRIFKIMEEAGMVPEDQHAAEALHTAVLTMRECESAKDKLAAARLILDFTKPKPASKTELTVRSHEDFLDELLSG